MIKNKRGVGFTLIELLIVIAIITILAAAVIVGINPARHFQMARNATRWNQMNSIASAVYSYAVEHGGAFPPNCIGEEGSPITITIEGDPGHPWCEVLIDDFIRVLPVPPLAKAVPPERYQIQFEGEGIKITSTAEEAEDIVLIQ